MAWFVFFVIAVMLMLNAIVFFDVQHGLRREVRLLKADLQAATKRGDRAVEVSKKWAHRFWALAALDAERRATLERVRDLAGDALDIDNKEEENENIEN